MIRLHGGDTMAEFTYKAISADGKAKHGTIEANNLDRAEEKLEKEGYSILSLKEAGALQKDLSINIGGKVKAKDLTMFCKQFASVLNAGVTIISALDMLSAQVECKALKIALQEMKVSVEKGNNLADSMRMHPKVFPPILVNMVKAGEASGSLETALDRMADHFEKDNHIQQAVKSAMMYPIIVSIVALAVTIVVMVVVIPNFASMFSDMGTKLPFMTRLMMGISDFIKQKWYILIGIVAIIVVIINMVRKTEGGQKFFSNCALKLPVLGNFTVKSSAARFSRTMSTLMAAGIPLIDAVESVGKIMTNKVIQDKVLYAKEEVAKGIPLSKPLTDTKAFPLLLTQMIHIGEETGNLENMMFKVADFYDEEVDEATKRLTAAMEPIIIIFLSLVVGCIVAAVYGPIISMYKNVDNL